MTLKSGLMGCSALCGLVMTTNTRLLGTILAFSVLTMTGHVQADCEELSFDGHSLARCKVWPAFKDQAIAAKSTFTPVSEDVNDGGMFDLELSIVNSTNDQTLATYCKNEAYNSDAVGFEGLIIDTARYKLAPHVRAFGLRSDFGHRSSAMPYSKTDLALYLREGNTLRPVLEGLVVAKNTGEWMGDCSGQGQDIRRTVDIGKSTHNGFADLIVTSSTTVLKNFKSGEECLSKTSDLKKTQITLSYDGKHYVVPEELKGY
ncbi:hypothetical protein [Pseudomonas frederiksbergensis]|jgi:hypothetical protein|uniref:hypothetical protein n=1 Tax=Pseudomonas frederiksbergensis TaxID=104087 RepID=UPI001E499D49|nr:hypothetical protein [Pseudomonas frederiksbergensis]